MKRATYLLPTLVTILMLLSGCASTIRSNVTAFNDWPANGSSMPYVFERSKAQDASLEYRSYENLVRNEVRRLGLQEANASQKPGLKIQLDFNLDVTDVRSIQPVYADPYFYGSGFYGRGFYGNRFYNGGFYGRPYYGFGYDPYFWGPPVVTYEDRSYQVSKRRLHVLISRYADNKSLYDVTVDSQGSNPSLPAVMPYLVHSAFADFPGKSGVPHTVELKVNN